MTQSTFNTQVLLTRGLPAGAGIFALFTLEQIALAVGVAPADLSTRSGVLFLLLWWFMPLIGFLFATAGEKIARRWGGESA